MNKSVLFVLLFISSTLSAQTHRFALPDTIVARFNVRGIFRIAQINYDPQHGYEKDSDEERAETFPEVKIVPSDTINFMVFNENGLVVLSSGGRVPPPCDVFLYLDTASRSIPKATFRWDIRGHHNEHTYHYLELHDLHYDSDSIYLNRASWSNNLAKVSYHDEFAEVSWVVDTKELKSPIALSGTSNLNFQLTNSTDAVSETATMHSQETLTNVKIYNIAGVKVYEGLSGSRYRLPSGLYFIQDGKQFRRMVIAE